MALEIHSPRPLRPGKRRLFESNEADDGGPAAKRPCRPLVPVPGPPQQRCRSDSFLMQAMATGRPKRESRTPRRYEGEVLPRVASVPVDPRRGFMNRSPVSLSDPYSPSISPAPFPRDIPTPATSITDDSRSSSRVKSPSYRDDLLRNKISIEPRGSELLHSVKEYGCQILHRARDSPELQQSQVESVMDTIYSLRNEDEDTIKSGYMSIQLLPGAAPYQGVIKMGSNIPFDQAGLPHVPLAPPLSMPKPDQHYCLDRMSFTAEEDVKQSSSVLRSHAKPSTAGCWPYFTVDFKSEARGGTFWVAENQNAGSGALCVNSMEKLLSLVDVERTEIDSISFSCNINAKYADIWIHYCRNQKFFSVELEHFQMSRAKDVVHFRNSFRNIVEFGFQDRLPQIKRILAKLALPDVEKMDKRQRTRKSNPEVGVEDVAGTTDPHRRHKRTMRSPSQSSSQPVSPPQQSPSPPSCTTGTIPIEVITHVGTFQQKIGRYFELNSQPTFVPDEDWERVQKSGRPAMINPTHNVWCFED